jgi:glycosyltransferase (activator-dependent family)
VRVLFVTYSEKTHFLSMVPPAWALRTAGHEVWVASQPELVDAITQAGLPAVAVGRDHTIWKAASRVLTKQVAESDPELYEEVRRGRTPPFTLPLDLADVTWDYLRHADRELALMARLVNSSMLDDLVGLVRHWRPDLVIWEPTTHTGAIAAAAVGAAHARFLWGPDHYGRLREHFLRLRGDQPPGALADWIGTQAGRHGLEFAEDMVTGQFTVQHLPPSLRLEADLRYEHVRYVPYGGPAVVPEWLRQPGSRPRVALTMGLSATERFDGYLVNVQDVLDALADLDVEVVATVAEREQGGLRRVPDNARVVSYVPLQALVPTCAAVIHHGGAGTVSTTAACGVPQLIVPDQGDGEYAAGRIAEQGAGLVLQPDEADGASVRENLLRLLGEPSFGKRAGELREEVLAMPTPGRLVDRLEELVESR